LLAMVPSTFGNWWVDEIPWFMPSLRSLILQYKPESRSSREEIHSQLLEKVAKGILGRKDIRDRDGAKLRLRHMNRLLNSESQQRTKEAMEDIIRDLAHVAEDQPLDVTDEHFLAVLYHKLGQNQKAEEAYTITQSLYEEEREKRPELRPLEALFLTD